MLALIQRVTSASVAIEGKQTAAIENGLLVLLGIEKADTEADAEKLLKKVLAYRVFADAQDKMNLSVQDVDGELLIVSQFTLAADTDQGLRPGFSSAKAPQEAKALYEYFLSCAAGQHDRIQSGVFAADMQISLVNDGPVTFILKS
ncbi:MAG: D-tyrosyl-tRNA(Tyr) deacylase [Gammaproteobacteria bacterium]|nr:D-tyrosyl-tRNA(Tyr) deacylase [Gammaproteobacteria bacterium]